MGSIYKNGILYGAAINPNYSLSYAEGKLNLVCDNINESTLNLTDSVLDSVKDSAINSYSLIPEQYIFFNAADKYYRKLTYRFSDLPVGLYWHSYWAFKARTSSNRKIMSVPIGKTIMVYSHSSISDKLGRTTLYSGDMIEFSNADVRSGNVPTLPVMVDGQWATSESVTDDNQKVWLGAGQYHVIYPVDFTNTPCIIHLQKVWVNSIDYDESFFST